MLDGFQGDWYGPPTISAARSEELLESERRMAEEYAR